MVVGVVFLVIVVICHYAWDNAVGASPPGSSHTKSRCLRGQQDLTCMAQGRAL